MKALRSALEDYLTTRRALGFKLQRDGKLLPDFIEHLAKSGSPFITSVLAVAWATQPRDARPGWWISRLVMVRGFAKHLQQIDPRTEIPPLELLPHRQGRTTPYVYSAAEIMALLVATEGLQSPMRTATYKALLGLLAVTGMRVGEAIALDNDDFDRDEGVLLIRKSKFGKTREVPLHHTTVAALCGYVHERDRRFRRKGTKSLFVSTAGRRLFYQNVHETFLRVLDLAGIADRRPRRPRLHDLRHTFAVSTVLAWYRAGVDVEAQMPLLSTYLGHVGPSATYWYLSAVPELLGAATARLERALKGEHP